MARRPSLEDLLAALKDVRADPGSGASLRALKTALGSRNHHAVAKAARLAGQCEIPAVVPELIEAFDHYMIDAASDRGCAAKAAIAEALYHLGHEEPAVFLRGIRHVQMEPVFGGRVDTAVDLRGACALGLVRMGYRDALLELADLLADREAPARIAAARAIAYRGGEDGVPLLRLKALVGDKEARVVSECLAALLGIAPEKSLAFVAGFLDSSDLELAEAAALALGESRLREAFDVLRVWGERGRSPERQRVALLAIAMLRRDPAFDFLLSLVREGPPALAAQALAALAIYKDEESIARRAREAAAGRSEPRVRQALAQAFGEPTPE